MLALGWQSIARCRVLLVRVAQHAFCVASCLPGFTSVAKQVHFDFLPANLAVLLTGLEFANRTRQIKKRALVYGMIASTTAIHFPNFVSSILANQFGRFWIDCLAGFVNASAARTMQRPDRDFDFVGSLA